MFCDGLWCTFLLGQILFCFMLLFWETDDCFARVWLLLWQLYGWQSVGQKKFFYFSGINRPFIQKFTCFSFLQSNVFYKNIMASSQKESSFIKKAFVYV